MNSVDDLGDIVHYDGSDDCILNVNGRLLITHELLQDFLQLAGEGRITFSGYWRAQKKGWERNFAHFSRATADCGIDFGEHAFTVPAFVQSFLHLIARPSMENVFLECVFDFISLVELDYVAAFSCDCSAQDGCLDGNILTAIYDNCCKFLQTLMLRYPAMAEKYHFVIDALHHAGHSTCSPLYNHKMNLAVSYVNASINEQKNKLLRYMQTSVAFMGQIRATVYIR